MRQTRTTHTTASRVCAWLACIALSACTGAQDQGSYKHGALPGKADAKKADAKKADAKKADAKKADAGELNCELPEHANDPECTKPEADDEGAAAGAPAAPGDVDPKVVEAAKKFKKGLNAPKGLSPVQVKGYALSQGDPKAGTFTLKDAFAGDDKLADKANGTLTAVFHTTMGEFRCELFEDKTPNTIANFVGLARGTRPWFDKMEDKWITDQPYYKDILFHRVIKGFMVQTGDRQASGRGNPGYVIVDEFHKTLRHKGPGILSMANRGKNTGSSQFFVTVKSTPHLDNKHAVFGKCRDPKVPIAISEVPVQGSRPIKPVKIEKVEIVREKK